MNILDKESIDYIENVCRTAKVVNINSIIIEPEKIRGFDESQSILLLQEDIPDLNIKYAGLNRIDVFLNRLELIKGRKNFSVEVLQDEDKEFIRGLLMKSSGMKVDYRCANPSTIRIPKSLNDQTKETLEITAEDVDILLKSISAMDGENVTIISDDRGVCFEISDINSDSFEYTWHEPIEYKFKHRYVSKTLTTLFKQTPKELGIGQKGIIKTKINDINIFMMPRI